MGAKTRFFFLHSSLSRFFQAPQHGDDGLPRRKPALASQRTGADNDFLHTREYFSPDPLPVLNFAERPGHDPGARPRRGRPRRRRGRGGPSPPTHEGGEGGGIAGQVGDVLDGPRIVMGRRRWTSSGRQERQQQETSGAPATTEAKSTAAAAAESFHSRTVAGAGGVNGRNRSPEGEGPLEGCGEPTG